jgi:hypothetical protein
MLKFGIITDKTDRELREICIRATNIDYTRFCANSRNPDIILAKQMYQYFLNQIVGVPAYAMELEYKDKEGLIGYNHSNIIHSVKTINAWKETDKDKARLIDYTFKRMSVVFPEYKHINLYNDIYGNVNKKHKLKTFEYKLLKERRLNHRTNV